MLDLDKEYHQFIDACASVFTGEEMHEIEKSYKFGLEKHKGKMRLNGTPYMAHPLGVALILLDLNVDAVTITASLIHETINHAGATKEEIESLFGNEVASIVIVISKLNRLELQDDSEYQAMNLRKIFHCLQCLFPGFCI